MEPAAEPRRAERASSVPAAFGAWLALLAGAARRRPALFAAFVAALAYLPFLTAGPIRGALEGNRLEVAREMLAGGDWVIPRLHDEPYLAKPPGQPWAMAIVSLPLGRVTLWTGRFVSVLSVILLAAWTARWSARALGVGAALPGAAALLACGVLLEKGTLAELEAPLVLTTAGALFCLWSAVRAQTRAWAFTALAGLCLGASILVKGPVGPLPVALCGAALIAVGPRRRRATGILVAVLALGFLIAAPWLWFAIERLGYDAFREVWDKEVVKRLPDAGPTNKEPFWYYAKALPAALGPAALLLPAAVVGARAAWRRERATGAFLLAWALGTILLFSFSSGKEVRYLLVTLPAWCAWIGLGLAERDASPRVAAYLRGLGAAGAWFLLAAPLVLGVASWILFPAGRAFVVAGAVLLLAGVSAVRPSARRGSTVVAMLALVLLLLGLRTLITGYLLERRSPLPLHEAGAVAARYLVPDEPLVFVGHYASPVQFALGRPFVMAADEADLAGALQELADRTAKGERLVLTRRVELGAETVAGWERLGAWGEGAELIRLYRLAP